MSSSGIQVEMKEERTFTVFLGTIPEYTADLKKLLHALPEVSNTYSSGGKDVLVLIAPGTSRKGAAQAVVAALEATVKVCEVPQFILDEISNSGLSQLHKGRILILAKIVDATGRGSLGEALQVLSLKSSTREKALGRLRQLKLLLSKKTSGRLVLLTDSKTRSEPKDRVFWFELGAQKPN